MNPKTIAAAILLVATIGSIGDAGAERIKANSKASGKAFTDCENNGGVSWPQSGKNQTYGCIDKNGDGLVCGGGSAEQQSTCDTFLTVPPRLPTRDEVFYAEQAAARHGGKKATAP
jgi:hypothetical protein